MSRTIECFFLSYFPTCTCGTWSHWPCLAASNPSETSYRSETDRGISCPAPCKRSTWWIGLQRRHTRMKRDRTPSICARETYRTGHRKPKQRTKRRKENTSSCCAPQQFSLFGFFLTRSETKVNNRSSLHPMKYFRLTSIRSNGIMLACACVWVRALERKKKKKKKRIEEDWLI